MIAKNLTIGYSRSNRYHSRKDFPTVISLRRDAHRFADEDR